VSTDPTTRPGLARRLLIGGLEGLPWPVEALLLGARLYAGYTIASAGLDKLPVPGWMEEQVAQMGFPAVGFFALVACLTEFAGGVALVFGLLTRPSAALLAFTMGMAAFRFHGVAPFTGMHIAQGFFWLFVVFVALGGGRLSVDHVLRGMAARSPAAAMLVAALLALGPAGYGLYLNHRPQPAPQEPAPVEITSMSVPGSFNDWDLTSHPLERQPDGTWAGTLVFEEAGPIAFKFAANGSWDVNLGDDDPGSAGFPVAGSGEPGGQNVSVYIPEPGRYRFAVDPVDFRYRVEAGDEPEPEQGR
jgi:putative oxidoreductase